MIWKQPRHNSAPGAEFDGPSPAHVTTDSGEPTDIYLTTDEMDPVQRAALDRVYGWLFAPLPEEGNNNEGQEAA